MPVRIESHYDKSPGSKPIQEQSQTFKPGTGSLGILARSGLDTGPPSSTTTAAPFQPLSHPPFFPEGYIMEVVTVCLSTSLAGSLSGNAGGFEPKGKVADMTRSLLKLAVLLFCVQRGESHWLSELLEQRRHSSSPPSEEERREGGEENDNAGSSGFGDRRDIVTSQIPIRFRRSTNKCGLRSVLLRVRDLGLGYDADEIILFKYCSGECPRVRSNHDLTVGNLLLKGSLPDVDTGEVWQSRPCCRPTHHEDLAFLDNGHHWHKVEKLSAAGCTCVG
ncbi:hypothetical protein DPEC_G00172090 [Dallia pectoralis]|uniref:Uncharacterized protein n=1 Tax=Dallia pectoralis TaxID=75939 RepID=A0ACC2GDR6_DALPE|nr:hypothetical protein DPEC_G00172090 [Dallia pectoralis]